ILKILALIFIYKLSGAIIEPIANGRIVDSLNGIAHSLILVLAAVISVAIMFFMVVTIIIGVGNVTIMMR
ncbi:MAG TPA: stage III sporulation protein AE, partial [Eubacteriaceae bacterium]|nr:stage III sporulation protein AE [Eubacteriaceae bacterium]